MSRLGCASKQNNTVVPTLSDSELPCNSIAPCTLCYTLKCFLQQKGPGQQKKLKRTHYDVTRVDTATSSVTISGAHRRPRVQLIEQHVFAKQRFTGACCRKQPPCALYCSYIFGCAPCQCLIRLQDLPPSATSPATIFALPSRNRHYNSQQIRWLVHSVSLYIS